MNAFQILDNQGNPLTMEQIDMEVCELTGNEVDPKHYCKLGNIKDFKSRREFAFNTYNLSFYRLLVLFIIYSVSLLFNCIFIIFFISFLLFCALMFLLS